jgi:putative permease
MSKIQKIKLYLFIFFVVASLVFAILFPRLTLPFGFAYIIYIMANPVTILLTKGTVRQRVMHSFLLILGSMFLLFPVFATLYNANTDLGALSQQLPEIQRIIQDKFFLFKVNFFEKYGIRVNLDPVNYLMAKLEFFGSDFISRFPDYFSTVFEWMLLVPMFLYFFFKESNRFGTKLMEAIPNPIFEKSYVLFSHFNTKFGEYIIAKFVEAAILGTLVALGLLVIGFPYPFILGFIAGITNILPYIGPLIGFIPAFGIALLSKDPGISMWGMVTVFAVANIIDNILVFPLLVSKIVNLHPILVVVSIIIGSQLGGIIGMIVIIPFIAFFKILFIEVYKDLSVNI